MTNDKRLHVVFWRWYSANPTWGGAEARLLSYLRHLDPTKVRATILTNTDLFSSRLAGLHLPATVELFAPYHDHARFAQYAAVIRLIRRVRPDRLVIVQGGFMDFLLSDLACAMVALLPRARRPVEFHLSSPAESTQSAAVTHRIGWRGRVASKVIAVSEGARTRMVNWYDYPHSKTQVIHHGIDVGRFIPTLEEWEASRAQIRDRLGISPGARTVISTARFSAEKHVDWIAEAARVFAEAHPDVHWLFVGDGPLRPEIESSLRSHPQLVGRVHFIGFVDDVREYLFASDIFVLASAIEGLSNAMLEAMAAGLVTVCTRAPGADDAIAHGISGLLCDIDSLPLREQIGAALSMDEESRSAMRRAAQSTVRDRFDKRVGIRRAMQALELPFRIPDAHP